MDTQSLRIPDSIHRHGNTGATRSIEATSFYAVLILIFAALIRLAFFSRGLGTDEIVYMTQAERLLAGDLGHASYIGAIRYGINGFQALSFALFGPGIVGASGLFFACSLANVMLVYWFADRLWGRRAAIWAGLALATLPIDVTLAGGLNPDPYLSLFITASIIAFYFAENRDSAVLYFSAGLLAGWVFWIKEEVIVFGLVFVFLGASQRRWRNGWLWFLFGGFLSWAADLIFFWAAYGDPIYHYKVVHQTVDDQIGGQVLGETSPWVYLKLLLVKIYHTGLFGWIALGGAVLALRRRVQPQTRFVLIWGAGLILIFSALPVSFWPLEFIRKQGNYMEIFVAPLALLAGWFLSQQRRIVTIVLGGAMVASGILLSGLEQQVIRVVTVNGPAAAAFAQAHAGTPVLGPLTVQRQSMIERLLRGSLDSANDIRPIADLGRLPLARGAANDIVAYLIYDPQMRNWQGSENERQGGADPGYHLPEQVRDCLLPLDQLEQRDLGLGHSVLAALRGAFSLFPRPLSVPALQATASLWEVEPAKVFAVTRACARQAQSST
jgi:hypothetical protein